MIGTYVLTMMGYGKRYGNEAPFPGFYDSISNHDLLACLLGLLALSYSLAGSFGRICFIISVLFDC